MSAEPDSGIIAVAEQILQGHAEVLRLEAEWEAKFKAPGWPATEFFRRTVVEPRVRRGWELRAQLASMRATSLTGFRAKARIVAEFSSCDSSHEDEAVAWSLANDLLGVPTVFTTGFQEEAELPKP